jgi:hypothetical protein
MIKSLILAAACACAALPSTINAGVIPVTAQIQGKSYAEWSAIWWQWAVSLPADRNPLFDQGVSVNGANGQSGRVWFLTGVINESGTAERSLAIPAGTMLFFPIINTECSTVEPDPFHGENEQELRECAAQFTLGNLVADIDGVAISDLEQFTVMSPMFQFTAPANNVLGVEPGTGFSVANGVYLMLAPLSVGEHTIHFGGTYIDANFTLDITYHVTVVPGR